MAIVPVIAILNAPNTTDQVGNNPEQYAAPPFNPEPITAITIFCHAFIFPPLLFFSFQTNTQKE
jgi:hypothetical protein